MKGLFHFANALREWLEPIDNDGPFVGLPDEGVCPYCRCNLEWNRVDESVSWCNTPLCLYDSTISEESNRAEWETRFGGAK